MALYLVALVGFTPVLSRLLMSAGARLRAAMRPSLEAGPSDVTMTMLCGVLVPLSEGVSSVMILIDIPGPSAALAGLSVIRQRGPAWLGTGSRTRIAQRTARRRYNADRQETIDVVPAYGMRVRPVHFVALRGRYRVVAVIGQADHRLPVVSMPLAAGPEMTPVLAGLPSP